MKSIIKKIVVRIYSFAQRTSQDAEYLQYRNRYTLHPSFKFNGPSILLYGEGHIKIGKNTYIGRNSTIQSVQGCEVSIGSFCAISHYVKIYTSSYKADQDFIAEERAKKTGSILIGDGVWIGANVLINPGVKIGSNSIIGANSVVTKDVQENTIVSGIPATLIRYKSK